MRIEELLALAVSETASDLHLSAGLPPMLRIDGQARWVDLAPLGHDDLASMLAAVMPEAQRRAYEENLDCDFSFAIQGLARFRVNAFVQRRGAAAAFRPVPVKPPSLDALGAPAVLERLASLACGLIVVTGVAGTGKSTTLAALIDAINRQRSAHILTIEHPIEFVHASKRCLINQREVGPMTLSVSSALRSALRENPDVVLVSDLHDPDSLRLALLAAESGHLVLGAMPTQSAVETIARVCTLFPSDERDLARAMLANSLQAVVSQTLVRRRNGRGRIAAYEILLGIPEVRELIRNGQLESIDAQMRRGSAFGMQTMDRSLAELASLGMIEATEASSEATGASSRLICSESGSDPSSDRTGTSPA